MHYRLIWLLFALLHGCGSSSPEPDSGAPGGDVEESGTSDASDGASCDPIGSDCGAATCEPGLDAGACPAQPEREAHCDGPFVQRSSTDSCDAVHPDWDTRSGVATVKACFALCADSPLCRESASVQYNPTTESCVLDASCSPESAGFHEYVASGGCAAPKQCWAWKEAEDPDACGGDPGGYGYFEVESIEDCIDPVAGKCMTERPYGCLLTSLGFVEYEYREIPCE